MELSKRDLDPIQVSMQDVRRLLDQISQEHVLIVDERERIVHANERVQSFTGYAAEELAGVPLGDVFKVAAPLPELYAGYFGAGTPAGQWPGGVLFTKDGEGVLYHFTMVQLGRAEYALMLLDQAGAAQPNLLQRFSDAFLKDVNLGVMLISPSYRLVDISDMACRVLGLERSGILNKSLEDVFAGVPTQHQFVQRSILNGVVVRNHAVSWTKNHERYELLLDSNVLRDGGGSIVGAYVIFKDVTNLRSLEEMVQRSDRLAMIGQIAAGTAHEIRNPLTSIKGFLQVLRSTFETKGMEKEKGYTEVMLTEITRINELVNEFLLLSKPKHVTYEAVDVSAVLRGILPIINNEAILYKVHLQYEACFHLPEVIADQELLKQVFLNISKNGIEAMTDGGTLTITEKIDPVERYVNIDIHDTGPGIPMFVIDKIFDPFFTTKDNGTGLGLSVCQRIIHDMGGGIRVASKGFGTTFTISIPYP
nr:PAS domain-containing sensor histidine kinase [Paenibacillus athensensis]